MKIDAIQIDQPFSHFVEQILGVYSVPSIMLDAKDIREKRVAEDEMVRYHHQLNGDEFEQTLGDREGKGNLTCCSPSGHRVRLDLVTKQTIKECKGTYIIVPVLSLRGSD